MSEVWKRPDEFLKLQRLKQKQKALAARLKRPATQPAQEIASIDKGDQNSTSKRRNPFAR